MPNRAFSAQLLFLGIALGIVGCGGPKQPDFPELIPTKGVVKKGKESVNGGTIQLIPEAPLTAFLVSSPIGSDGSISLITTRTTDKVGENRPGAPAGKYKVLYRNTEGGSVELTVPVTVKAGEDLTIDTAKRADLTPKSGGSTIGGDPKKGVDPKKK